MRKLTLLLTLFPAISMAQSLTEKKAVRLYEHHSSSINGNKQFGSGANGTNSGYDFVNHAYYGSFKPGMGGGWTAAELQNIDMVEHNGRFGNNGPFGFTSGVSTIWGGDIKGNGTTVYMEAPASFNYTSATKVSDIKNVFDSMKAAKAVTTVQNGKIYLARIRNSNQYVAMKVTDVLNLPTGFTQGIADVYFDFDYKYGTYDPTTGINDMTVNTQDLQISPNPAKGIFKISLPTDLVAKNTTLTVIDLAGKIVLSERYQSENIEHHLSPGVYAVRLTDGFTGYQSRLVIAE